MEALRERLEIRFDRLLDHWQAELAPFKKTQAEEWDDPSNPSRRGAKGFSEYMDELSTLGWTERPGMKHPAPGPLTVSDALSQTITSRSAILDEMERQVDSVLEMVPEELRVAIRVKLDAWLWPENEEFLALQFLLRSRIFPIIESCYTYQPFGPNQAWFSELLPTWPQEIAPVEVANWAIAGLKRLGREDGLEPIESLVGKGSFHFSSLGYHYAVVYRALREVESHQAIPAIKVGAHMEGRAAFQALTLGGAARHDTFLWSNAKDNRGTLELVWDGKPRKLQLELDFTGEGVILQRDIIRGILAELAEDGVRDWLVYHQLSQESGSTGRFIWTWPVVRERGEYRRRVENRNATDENLCQAAIRRLYRLKRAELKLWLPIPNGTQAWRRIGPHGLVDIPAGLESSESLPVALMVSINPEIYRGAERGGNLFALIPSAVLALRGDDLGLATMVCYDFGYERTTGGIIRRAAGQLWEYAGIREGRSTERKRWPAASEALQRALDRIGQAMGGGFNWTLEGNPGPNQLFKMTPPNWWIDRAMLGVPPQENRSLATVPRTGRELKAWRETRGLSQREVARRSGIDQKRLSRWESKNEESLPAELVAKLAGLE
jgi:Helix-turn-helix